MIQLDGIEVKVGSQMWAVQLGWVTVTGVNSGCYSIETHTPIFGHAGFTVDGCYIQDGPRSLFWDEVKIIPPAKPKRIVKKEVVKYINDAGVKFLLDIGTKCVGYRADQDECYSHKVTLTFEVEE
jgi:hypothetical protein